VLVADARDDAIFVKVRTDGVTEPGLERMDDLLPPRASSCRKGDYSVGGVICLHGTC
jgi:hypothetical protein